MQLIITFLLKYSFFRRHNFTQLILQVVPFSLSPHLHHGINLLLVFILWHSYYKFSKSWLFSLPHSTGLEKLPFSSRFLIGVKRTKLVFKDWNLFLKTRGEKNVLKKRYEKEACPHFIIITYMNSRFSWEPKATVLICTSHLHTYPQCESLSWS